MYWDIAVGGKLAGRVEFALFYKEAPLAAENFRALCTGERGVVPPGREGQGHNYAFKGNRFYRIVHDFMIQTGTPTESVYGGHFPDDPGGLALPHNRPGLVSMANNGRADGKGEKWDGMGWDGMGWGDTAVLLFSILFLFHALHSTAHCTLYTGNKERKPFFQPNLIKLVY